MTHNPMTIDERTAIIDAGAGSEKDAGFCSCGDEDDISDLQSRSVSEDSLEAQVTPISSKNKRKSAEPRKLEEENPPAPLKKRRFEAIEEELSGSNEASSRTLRSLTPFRPWRSPNKQTRVYSKKQPSPNPITEKSAFFLPNAPSHTIRLVSNHIDNRRDLPHSCDRCNCDDGYDDIDSQSHRNPDSDSDVDVTGGIAVKTNIILCDSLERTTTASVDSQIKRNHDSDSDVDVTGGIAVETNVILRDSLGTIATDSVDSQTNRNQDDLDSNVNVTSGSSEKDAGFCSCGDEDDISDLQSRGVSEDSLEVQVIPMSLKNRRKLAEPRKIEEQNSTPLKKRRFEAIEEQSVSNEAPSRTLRSPCPFRPWRSPIKKIGACSKDPSNPITEKSAFFLPNAPSPTISVGHHSWECCNHRRHRRRRSNCDDSCDNEDIDTQSNQNHDSDYDVDVIGEIAVKTLRDSVRATTTVSIDSQTNRNHDSDPLGTTVSTAEGTAAAAAATTETISSASKIYQRLQEEPLSLVLREDVAARVPSHPAINGSYEKTAYSAERVNVSSSLSSSSSTSSLSSSRSSLSSSSSTSSYLQQNHRSIGRIGSCSASTATVTTTTTVTTPTTSIQNGQSRQHPVAGQQRNYKNMTRERRIEANARERTRVHTISAAFDTLRRAIPAYSHNQKLSKLSVLRIACSYIMTLSNIVNTPEGESPNGASLGNCVDLVSRTIQTEGKLRKRKED